MDLQNITLEEIPHGHGASFKKGISDAILDQNNFENNLPTGHNSSYDKGKNLGKELKKIIANKVKK